MSLVAYQSGDESEGGDSDQEPTASENESETSKHSSNFEIIDTDYSIDKRASIKRDRVSAELSDEIECSDDEAMKKSKTHEESVMAEELFNNGSPAVSFKAGSELMEIDKVEILDENAESNESELVVSSSKFTLENGFPVGCDGIKLPSAPTAPCSQSLQNKISQVVDRMERFNYSINNDIRKKKQFKNPSIYEKLIDVWEIDEFGSSFPQHVEELKSEGYLFYDELDSTQRAEWARIEKLKKDRTKIEMVSGTKKGSK